MLVRPKFLGCVFNPEEGVYNSFSVGAAREILIRNGIQPNEATREIVKALPRLSLVFLIVLAAATFLVWRRTEAGQAPRGVSATRSSAKPENASLSPTLQTERNVGKAYYEQGKYPEAAQEFEKVIASGHALATDHMDLGLALMQDNKLDAALGELTTAKQMAPKLVAVAYNLGILYKRELRYPDAEAALKRVVAADPNDPAAWFNLGDVYFAEKDLPASLAAHERVVSMGLGHGQNFYVAALFHTFTILIRMNKQAEAQKVLKVHEKVRDMVPSISLQSPALEGGKYGAILVPRAPETASVAKVGNAPVKFQDITSSLGINLAPMSSPGKAGKAISAREYSLEYARKNLVPLFGPSIAVGDYDGDGRPDLYLVNPAGTNHLFHANADGTYTDVTEKAGVAGPGGSLSAAFADYNNSGHPSLFVVGLGGVTLYRNKGDGTFVNETEKAKLAGNPGELDTRAVLFDADDDGFLDLVVTAYTNLDAPPSKPSFVFPQDFKGAQSHFYRNNGDGTFTDVTEASGLNVFGRTRGAAFADFDNDGYADLVFVRDDASPFLFMNQGEDKFLNRTSEAGADFQKSRADEVRVADFNHDGNFDLALWSPSRYEVLLNRGGGKFAAEANLPNVVPASAPFAFRGTIVDARGDGSADLLVADAKGKMHLLTNRERRFEESALSLPNDAAGRNGSLSWLAPALLRNPGKLDLLGITRAGEVKAFEREGPPAGWVEVRLEGYKSNSQGYGTTVEIKAGNYYNKVLATSWPVRVFTGDLKKLDVVRVTWPNQVIQNSIDVTADQTLEVRESERLASSCPFLYVWNGRRYVFFTDVLGVAPIGELAPDGTRIAPHPEEFVHLPSDLQAQDGLFTFQLTDEMREVDYFDQLRLVAVDHPASEEVYSNEIYSSSPAPPSIYLVGKKHFPLAAVDDHGHNILPLLLKADGRYPTDFRRNRILGLADLHSLTLDLGNFPENERIALWLTGWVFWTDSNASRALMTNSKLQMVSPYLQVRNAQGQWVTVIPDMGLPSGTNRTMRVDLTGKFLSSDHHVRIVTNLCVYWDRVFYSINDSPARVTGEAPLVAADLHYRGFSEPSSDPKHQRPDNFDYVHLMRMAPWNPMRGRYTRYGPVGEFLTQNDDRLVVMATGDEMTVKFNARGLPPLKPGWKRDFLLYTAGYAKDGEPNTAAFRTVGPMPFREMTEYPYGGEGHYPDTEAQDRYLREYETRPGYLLIPPLAPAAR